MVTDAPQIMEISLLGSHLHLNHGVCCLLALCLKANGGAGQAELRLLENGGIETVS